jgi:hypothetical protein
MPAEPTRCSATTASATLDEVDIRLELQRRPSRPPDLESEHQAFRTLA